MKHKIALFILFSFMLSCGNGVESRFPMEKRFWNPEDYKEVYREIRFNTPEGERYPELKNPDTAPVFKKLIDRQNYMAVLNDEQLGLSHRNEIASNFFDEFRSYSDVYYSTNRQDKFVYGMELVELYKFGLDLQVYYFKLGNENILKESDDPNSSNTRRVIKSNETTLLKNYNNYLDYVNKEDGFSEQEIKAFCEGIDTAFPKLFETFPNSNLNITKKKAELMLNKTKNDLVKSSLEQLLNSIDERQEPK
ncbi:hypothetical protein SAMN04488029_2323 [Reichenbachiella faecimaris]|uniref:Lipoprotein n=1 Tax=Reichenbachiella faecimaris TaxID=692418 RepID=A0A1W2GEG7_REIFA|nr:hypothetical protein [Reichenbachiella faecimaris]SMD35069.1 hypothetical protein SAMN04488029_2323 [Reichenbachiella faecimaris]